MRCSLSRSLILFLILPLSVSRINDVMGVGEGTKPLGRTLSRERKRGSAWLTSRPLWRFEDHFGTLIHSKCADNFPCQDTLCLVSREWPRGSRSANDNKVARCLALAESQKPRQRHAAASAVGRRSKIPENYLWAQNMCCLLYSSPLITIWENLYF